MIDVRPPRTSLAAPIEKTLDSKTLELLALASFRSIFGQGVVVPLRKEGMMDMDLVIRDSNVLLNMNSIQAHAPELLIWRFTFAYQGKPVVEYGRGIKNDMKLHFPQLLFLLVSMWRDKRRQNQARLRADRKRDREMAATALAPPTAGAGTGRSP
jgi:hypothetical protein